MIAVISKSRGIYAKKGWIDERMNSSPEWTVIGGAEKRQESGGWCCWRVMQEWVGAGARHGFGNRGGLMRRTIAARRSFVGETRGASFHHNALESGDMMCHRCCASRRAMRKTTRLQEHGATRPTASDFVITSWRVDIAAAGYRYVDGARRKMVAGNSLYFLDPNLRQRVSVRAMV